MRKILATSLVVFIVILLSACGDNKESKTTKSVDTKSSNQEVLHSMYAVGDIYKFDENLKPLAEKLVTEDPNASWWILGDGGYGDGAEVTNNYQQIVEVFDENVRLYSIIGDHDYGTQDPSKFTAENRLSVGANNLLNASQNFVFTVDSHGDLRTERETDKDESTNSMWAILGTNDICVETGPMTGTDCSDELFNDFEKNLVTYAKKSKCSIAMYHHPVFAVLKDGGNDQQFSDEYGTPYFASSIDNGVDIILNADHHEFLATKQINKDGKLKTKTDGQKFTRQFIVGSGGAPLSYNNNTPKLGPETIEKEIRNQVGVLKIDLYPKKAIIKFVTIDGVQYETQVDC